MHLSAVVGTYIDAVGSIHACCRQLDLHEWFDIAEKIAGIAGTIGTTVLAVIAYLVVTFAYKSEKRMIMKQVRAHVVVADIAKDQSNSKVQAELLVAVGTVSCSITRRCLQMWDGFLGLRARTDSVNKRTGIWLDKFETVRYASMLMALQRTNSARRLSGMGQTWFGSPD